MIRIKDTGQFEFLFGKKKAQFLRYADEKKSFYQAQAASDLGWTIGAVQYYCRGFVKHHFLKEEPTSYKTFYEFNIDSFSHLF
jgi:hypothetical protein